jgi:hypothetical protein
MKTVVGVKEEVKETKKIYKEKKRETNTEMRERSQTKGADGERETVRKEKK